MGSSSRHHRHHSDSKRPSSSGWKRSRSISSSDSYSSRGGGRREDDRRRDDRIDDRGRDHRRSSKYYDDDRRPQHHNNNNNNNDRHNNNRNGQPPTGFNCHLCSAPSHWTRDCPHVRLNPTRFTDINPATGCHQCGRPGHKLGNCPNQKYLCKECAGMHSSKVCPNSFVPREYHAFYSTEEDRVYYERVRPVPNKSLWSRIRGLSAVSLPHGADRENETPEAMLQRRKQEEKLAAHKEEDSYVEDWTSYGKRCRSPTRPWLSWYVQPRELDVILWHCTTCKTLQPNTVQLCVGCGCKMPVGQPAPLPASLVESNGKEEAVVAKPTQTSEKDVETTAEGEPIKSEESPVAMSDVTQHAPAIAPAADLPEVRGAEAQVAENDVVKA